MQTSNTLRVPQQFQVIYARSNLHYFFPDRDESKALMPADEESGKEMRHFKEQQRAMLLNPLTVWHYLYIFNTKTWKNLPCRFTSMVLLEPLPQTFSEPSMPSSLLLALALPHSPPSYSQSCTGSGPTSGSAQTATTSGQTIWTISLILPRW